MCLDRDIFIAVSWPETQELLEYPDFLANAVLINDGCLYEEYGPASYMVRKQWLETKK